jgi:hypothetical protein
MSIICLQTFGWLVRRRILVALLGALFIGGAPAGVLASQNVALSWQPSPDDDLAGYNVYYGSDSGRYTAVLNLDNVTFATVDGLAGGVTYYFVVTATDWFGNESEPTQEVSYTVPLPAPTTLQTQVFNDDNGLPAWMAVTATCAGLGWWELDASPDLQNWSFYTYGYGTDVFVLFPLTDATQPQLFFRLVNYYW